jgi:hypothetical protein
MAAEPEERSRRERMLAPAARQQALAEVLLQIRRLTGAEATPCTSGWKRPAAKAT